MSEQPLRLTVINGPNLYTLGLREPNIYGDETYDDLVVKIQTYAKENHCHVTIFQSNAEHELIDCVQKTRKSADALIVNFGAFTHTSVALRDALLFADKPFVELHVSNVFAREPFRHKSFFADIAEGVIAGLGTYGYLAAITYFIKKFE